MALESTSNGLMDNDNALFDSLTASRRRGWEWIKPLTISRTDGSIKILFPVDVKLNKQAKNHK